MPCSQFMPDSKERKAFFNECAKKEKNYAYLNAEHMKRAKITPKVFAACASLCGGDDYPNLKGLPADAFDILFPKDGLQSCHWELLLQSNTFLKDRLAHFNEWVGEHGLPANLADMRDSNVASAAAAAQLHPDAAAEIAALKQKVFEQQIFAGNAFAVNQRLLAIASQKAQEATAATAAFQQQNAATAALLAAMLPLSAMGGADLLECYYCQNGRCNQH
jgi:hypothetical protein